MQYFQLLWQNITIFVVFSVSYFCAVFVHFCLLVSRLWSLQFGILSSDKKHTRLVLQRVPRDNQFKSSESLWLSSCTILSVNIVIFSIWFWGYRGGSHTAVQAWQPCPLWEPSCKNRLPYNLYCVGGDVKYCSLTHCGSHPLVTPYYCRLGDLLCFVFMSAYCMFDLSVYYMYLCTYSTQMILLVESFDQ